VIENSPYRLIASAFPFVRFSEQTSDSAHNDPSTKAFILKYHMLVCSENRKSIGILIYTVSVVPRRHSPMLLTALDTLR
jgi:hypothetical protein